MQREKEKNIKLEEVVQNLTLELGFGKDKVMLSDIKVQELQFEVQDLYDKIKQFEKKEGFQRNQIEQLQA